MSKITMKAIMYTVLIAASSTSQVFSAGEDLPDHNKKVGCLSYFNIFRSCMRDAANDVREAAPVIQAVGNTAILVGQVTATASGNTKLAHDLGTAQIVLNGAADVVNANDIRMALKISEETALAIDPKAAKGIDRFNKVVDVLAPQAELIAALAKTAAANADAKHS